MTNIEPYTRSMGCGQCGQNKTTCICERYDSSLLKLWDCNGVRFLPGDILHVPSNSFNPYHFVLYRYKSYSKYELEIRDLNANNVHMWEDQGPIENLGPWFLHLDLLGYNGDYSCLEDFDHTISEAEELKERWEKRHDK